MNFRVNSAQSLFVQWSMQAAEQLDPVTIQRLRKQAGFLQRIHQAEFDKDPSSHATESSRSNVIAMQHTVTQMYGETVARNVGNFEPPFFDSLL